MTLAQNLITLTTDVCVGTKSMDINRNGSTNGLERYHLAVNVNLRRTGTLRMELFIREKKRQSRPSETECLGVIEPLGYETGSFRPQIRRETTSCSLVIHAKLSSPSMSRDCI